MDNKLKHIYDHLDWKRFCIAIIAFAVIFFAINAGYFIEYGKYYLKQNELIERVETYIVTKGYSKDTLYIKKTGVIAPIIYVEENSESVFQKALTKGVVHHPDTALPGEYGNSFIFGHSSDFLRAEESKYKHIFATLPELGVGDEIIITDSEGNDHHYLVRDTDIVKPTDTHILDQYNQKSRILTLQTSYPLGTALKRFIVIAEIPESSDQKQESNQTHY